MEYLNHNTHRFKNQETAREGIQHGIKMLVCETLLGTITISAILCFKYCQFHAVKFEELRSLMTMMDQTEWIKELLVDRSGDWFDNCQKKYNGTSFILELAGLESFTVWCNEMLQKLVLPMSLATRTPIRVFCSLLCVC